MLVIQRPSVEALGEDHATRQRFAVGPLEPGFGHTIGNSMRRALLSSIPGAAITTVKFDNAQHEFTTLPGMTVVVPCDYNQTKQATIAIADLNGPVYLRFGRPVWPIFTTPESPFVIGKAQVFNEGKDVSLFACGHMVWKTIEAARVLAEKGIHADVINVHTIKPLDREAVLASIRKTGCAVSAEEHNVIGGLGDSIAQLAARECPVPMEFIGTQDTFGESGKPMDLLKKYGLETANIVEAAEKAIARRGK